MIIEAEDPGQAFPLPSGSNPLVDIATGKERHIVAAHGTARLRLCVRHAPSRPVPTYAIPCDAACVLRLAAASRLQRVMRGDRIAVGRTALPTPNQRARYTGLLRVHDALEAAPRRATSPSASSFLTIARLQERYGRVRAKGGTCSG